MNDLQRWRTLVEEDDRVLYHVTPTRNLPKIMQQGLVPKIGPRARHMREPIKGIYLFRSTDDAESGVMNWLGDYFGDDTRLALLAVKVPPGATEATGAGFETVLTEPVPPDRTRCAPFRWPCSC
jgi:hypothetical protein